MNSIRAIQALNKRELEHGISPEASWHTDYRDTAFINFGGLPYNIVEGDIITIFSQYGEPTFLKLARDKESGKSKGFGWLKYEDQRSTDLAVDNLGGAEIGGRLIRVDHARYKPRDDEDPDEFRVGWEDMVRREKGGRSDDVEMRDGTPDDASDSERGADTGRRRPTRRLPEEEELARLIEDHDEDDPMKAFLVEEKKAEVDKARRRDEKRRDRDRDRERHHRHRSHRHHDSHKSSRRDDDRRGRSKRDVTPRLGDRDDSAAEAEARASRGGGTERRRARDDDSRDRARDHDKDRRRRRRHDDDNDDDDDDGERRRKRDRDRRIKHGERDTDRARDRRERRRSRSRSPRPH